YKVEYNILTVVSKTVAKHIQKIFNFFKKNNFRYLQFIPCLDPLEALPGQNIYSLTPDLFEEFLIRLFDLYYVSAIENNYISIRFFDNLIQMLMGHPPESCGMSGICVCQFVVEGNGNVYPCDFYCVDQYCMGNIRDLSIEELFNTRQAQDFIKESFHINDACKNCSFYQICRGGCKRYREPFVQEKPGLNIYCESYKSFYKQCLPRLQHLAHLFNKA
ncbi:MAG TPA: anaerobic sulfatase maturase, partial [Clostridiales bacterium]|nr:anaerobic sulfatase maturase [Clostridiales bacterium]